MWVDYNCDSSLLECDFIVHCFDIVDGEVLWIKLEVFIAPTFTILLGPEDVHPEHIYWESID